MGADGALNGAPLDRALDQPPPAPAVADPVEGALAAALAGATAAGRWDVVSQLAKELEARRLANTNVVVGMFSPRRGRLPPG